MRLALLQSELDNLVGLAEVKREISTFTETYDGDGTDNGAARALVLGGPPGTGKATVAELCGQLLAVRGDLADGQLIRLDRATVENGRENALREGFAAARGGVLLIEDAYRLALVGDDADLVAVLNDLVTGEPDLLLVLSGHEEELEMFLAANPALEAVIARRLAFPGLGIDELVEIFERQAQREGFQCTPAALAAVRDRLGQVQRDRNFTNGHHVRALLDDAVAHRADQQQALDPAGLNRILDADDILVQNRE